MSFKSTKNWLRLIKQSRIHKCNTSQDYNRIKKITGELELYVSYAIDLNWFHRRMVEREIRRTFISFEKVLQLKTRTEIVLDFIFCDDDLIKDANFLNRHKWETTDVITLTSSESSYLKLMSKTDTEPIFAEIYINVSQAKRQSKELKNLYLEEIRWLLTHSLVHAVGLDHESSLKENRKFKQLENMVSNKIRERLK